MFQTTDETLLITVFIMSLSCLYHVFIMSLLVKVKLDHHPNNWGK